MDPNLNPHKPARVAMILWCERYAKQNGGALDFWKSLTDYERRTCRELVEQIEAAPNEFTRLG